MTYDNKVIFPINDTLIQKYFIILICTTIFLSEILKVESLPDGKKLIENVVSYDWSIDTKYYTADVKLCHTRERTIGNKEFAESVQAFVVYFDAEKVSISASF